MPVKIKKTKPKAKKTKPKTKPKTVSTNQNKNNVIVHLYKQTRAPSQKKTYENTPKQPPQPQPIYINTPSNNNSEFYLLEKLKQQISSATPNVQKLEENIINKLTDVFKKEQEFIDENTPMQTARKQRSDIGRKRTPYKGEAVSNWADPDIVGERMDTPIKTNTPKNKSGTSIKFITPKKKGQFGNNIVEDRLTPSKHNFFMHKTPVKGINFKK